MYDLKVVYPDRPAAAVEVTGDVDDKAVQLWKLLYEQDKRWIVPDLVGGWDVRVRTTASVKRLRQELPGFLRQLEEAGTTIVEVDSWSTPDGPTSVARDLRVVSMHQGDTDFPGSVYVLPDDVEDDPVGVGSRVSHR